MFSSYKSCSTFCFNSFLGFLLLLSSVNGHYVEYLHRSMLSFAVPLLFSLDYPLSLEEKKITFYLAAELLKHASLLTPISKLQLYNQLCCSDEKAQIQGRGEKCSRVAYTFSKQSHLP